MYTWKITKWTSELIISANININEDIKQEIIGILDHIRFCYSKFEKVNQHDDLKLLTSDYLQYGLDGDVTCMLKGLALDEIHKILRSHHSKSHIISFGGDIFGYNTTGTTVEINETNFQIDIQGTYSIFTSGNTDKRGNHIFGCQSGRFITYVVKWDYVNDRSNTLVDIIATKLAANENISKLIKFLREHNVTIWSHVFEFKDSKLTNSVYCASPFFNDYQITTRDRMISKFNEVFRPDRTDASLKYDGEKGNSDLVHEVVQANLDGIYQSELLVYPKFTTDLGTLFEVGRAFSLEKCIIQYDDKLDKYIIITKNLLREVDSQVDSTSDYKFDCNDKSQAILMGYMSNYLSPNHVFYELKGSNDNIMLSVNYNHIEFDKELDNYILIERNKDERDK